MPYSSCARGKTSRGRRALPAWFALLAFASHVSGACIGEQLIVASTNYAIPSGAIFVSLNGSDDAGQGTEGSPYRTVSRALDAAGAGDTVVIRQGTYREQLPTVSRSVTLQPYPDEEAWLKGSVVVSGWVNDGNAWRKDGWTNEFCQDCFHPLNIDPAFPNAGLPDQVFIDGEPLEQVTSINSVNAGSFYVDYGSNQLFVGSNPAGRLVEASIHGRALRFVGGAEGSVVRGLGFAHYSPVAENGLGGMVIGDAANLSFENNTFAHSAVKGLSIFAPDAKVRANTFICNGMMGLAAWRADRLTVVGNRFVANNHERFVGGGVVAEASGSKITQTKTLTVTDNIFEDNSATGLWIDINGYDAVIARNSVRNNSRVGIDYEISSNGIIASNIVSGSGSAGIALRSTTDMQVYNNTLVRNGLALVVQDDGRVNDDPQELALGITWISDSNFFLNNIIFENDGQQEGLLWVRDNSAQLDGESMLTESDYNAYYRSNASVPSRLAEWWRGGMQSNYANLADYQAGTGKDFDSFAIDNEPSDPFFVDERSGNYALRTDSPAVSAGTPLPFDVAEAIGVTDTSVPDLGALLLPGGDPVTPDSDPGPEPDPN